MAYVAKESGYRSIFVPQADAPEAALVEGIDVYRLIWNPEYAKPNRTG